jgi:tetratricopeptide (TPR) repeat protein
LLLNGEYEEAIDAFERAARVADVDWLPQAGVATALARSGERDRALEILEDLRRRSEEEGVIFPAVLAVVYTTLGDLDNAFAQLEEAIRVRDPRLFDIIVHPMLDDLHSDPRYHDLMQRVGLPSE